MISTPSTMHTASVIVLFVVGLLALGTSVSAQDSKVWHYPLTVDDLSDYLPPEMLAQVKTMSFEDQRVWAWKQTDLLIDHGIIKRQKGWIPFSESIASVAEDFVPGAGRVVRQVASDLHQVGQDVGNLVNDPSIHNLATTVADTVSVPANAENGAKRVLKNDAGQVLDRNNLSALKPLANAAIDAGVGGLAPIPASVQVAGKIATAVENHTDEQDHVLVCSVADHNAAVAAAAAPVASGAAAATPKSLMEVTTSSLVDHAVDAQAEALWKVGIIPKSSCHYVPGKALKARGFALPKKPKLGKKVTSKAKSLAPGAVALPASHPTAKAAMQNPKLKAALTKFAAKTYKPKFVHPALRGLGVVAVPATPARAAPANAKTNKRATL